MESGFDLTIIDPRTAFASAARFEGADLHAVWPNAELSVSPESGHSAFEPQNVDALVRATDGFA